MGDSICPHLGLNDDESTFSTYPSERNVCHHVRGSQEVNLDYQSSTCLGSDYKNCPVYQEKEKPRSLPAEIKRDNSPSLPMKKIFLGIGIIVGTLLIIALIAEWPISLQVWRRGQPTSTLEGSVPTSHLTPSSIPSPSPTLTPTLTQTPTHFPTLTLTATITRTPLPTHGPGVGTPFGPESRFLIHTIEEGQSFAYLETKYNTTRDVIESTNNHIGGSSLWVGENVVVIIDQKEISDLPKFEVIFTETSTNLIELAEQYGVQVSDIRYYNALGDEATVPADRWMIIPLKQ